MARRINGRKAALFRRTSWRGEMNYECLLCAYATLEPLRMAEHLRAAHGVVMDGTEPDGDAPIILVHEDEVKE